MTNETPTQHLVDIGTFALMAYGAVSGMHAAETGIHFDFSQAQLLAPIAFTNVRYAFDAVRGIEALPAPDFGDLESEIQKAAEATQKTIDTAGQVALTGGILYGVGFGLGYCARTILPYIEPIINRI